MFQMFSSTFPGILLLLLTFFSLFSNFLGFCFCQCGILFCCLWIFLVLSHLHHRIYQQNLRMKIRPWIVSCLCYLPLNWRERLRVKHWYKYTRSVNALLSWSLGMIVEALYTYTHSIGGIGFSQWPCKMAPTETRTVMKYAVIVYRILPWRGQIWHPSII